jgi:TRAP-type C4-dicarboxylate transport system permease small subunit
MEIEGNTRFTRVRQSINSISGWLEWVGLAALVGMVLIALIDVIGSEGFQWPLPGSTEITSFLLVIAIAAGLAFSQIAGRHIRVGFLIDKLPRRGKIVLELFSSVLGLGLFAMIGWVTYDYGLRLLSSGTETLLLRIVHYPFAFWIAFCCIPMCCVILIELLSYISKMLK